MSLQRVPYTTCAVVGLGGLFAGVTGPLLSAFVPLLVRDAVGEHRSIVGAVMAIDNILLLLLVPWAGMLSDRASRSGRGRLPLVLLGCGLAAIGMAAFPRSAALGIWGLIGAMVLLHSGINLQRAPFQALLADAVASRYRSIANASVTFQMCVGAVVFLLLGRSLGMQPAFLTAAATTLAIGVGLSGLRPTRASSTQASPETFQSIADAVRSVAHGRVPGLRPMFVAALLLQIVFQSFTTWFALHGTARFGVRPEDVTVGFIAWSVGGVLGALPAGVIGVRIGRRAAMLVGLGLMFLCFVALDRVPDVAWTTPLLVLASASWTLPTVNAYPLFIEQIPEQRRGVLAALFLLCMALGGAVGDPLNGAFFDLLDGYRTLFLLLAAFTGLTFVVVLAIPKGAGEAVIPA